MWSMFLCAACVFFKQKTAYERRISDWSSDVCSSDLPGSGDPAHQARVQEDVAVRIQILDIRAVIEDVGDRASRQSRKDREVEGTISRSDDDDPFARLRQAEVRGEIGRAHV